MQFTKKASLNLSINAIVILILAITMLGLGLAFMRNIFGSATEEFTAVSGTVKKQMVDQMKETTKIIDISQPKVSLRQGADTQIFIGFKNEGASEVKYQIRQVDASFLNNPALNKYYFKADGSLDTTSGLSIPDASGICGVRYGTTADEHIFLEFKRTPTTVAKGDVIVLPINIETVSDADIGTCVFEIKVDTDVDTDPTDPTDPTLKDYSEVIELTVDIKS